MAKTKIEWTGTPLRDGGVAPGYTWNPWIGCAKVGHGCDNCYAQRLMDTRYGRVKWGPGRERVRTSKAYWRQMWLWNRRNFWCPVCECWTTGPCNAEPTRCHCGKEHLIGPLRPKVFIGSLCDWLDDEVPIEWFADLMWVLKKTPNLDKLLLTKRAGNWPGRMDAVLHYFACHPPGLGWAFAKDWRDWPTAGPGARVFQEPIWVGSSFSIESDKYGYEMWNRELMRRIPAKIHFGSLEPMLAPALFEGAPLDWLIIGGESGPGARFCDPNWIMQAVKRCQEDNQPVFVKQFGSNCGLNLKDPKGGDMAEWPEWARVREWPQER